MQKFSNNNSEMSILRKRKKSEEAGASLEKLSVTFHDSGSDKGLLVNTVSDESHYVSENSKQTVTILYPQSGLPLLSTNSGEFVNIVELPNVEVEGSLELDDSLECQRTLVLQQNFVNDGHIEVIAGDTAEPQLHILGAHDLQRSDNETVTFKTSASDVDFESSRDNDSSLLSGQLVHVPTTVGVANNHTITLPFSFIDESGEVSLLSGLSQLPMSIENENNGDVSLPVGIHSNAILYSSNSDATNYILPHHMHGTVNSTQENYINLTKGKSHITSYIHQQSSNDAQKIVKSSHVGRPPKVKKNRVIGFGPTAISAQGVIQEIDNRLVTVLPRPEDLKKLIDNKQLILQTRSNTCDSQNTSRRKLIPFMKQLINDETRVDASKREFKNKDTFDFNFIKKKSFQENSLNDGLRQHSIFPKIRKRKKRGRKKSKPWLFSGSHPKAGKQNEVKSLPDPKLPVVKDANYIPNSSCDTAEKFNVCNFDDLEIKSEFIEVGDKKETHTKEESFNNDDLGKNLALDIQKESPECSTKRKLPPRNRGSKYKKLIETLKRQECDDDEYDEEFVDDESGAEFNEYVAPLRPKDTSGPGKRGRPRKNKKLYSHLESSVCSSDHDGTRIIELAENLKPIHLMNLTSSLIEDDSSPGESHQKLVITLDPSSVSGMTVQPSIGQFSDHLAKHECIAIKSSDNTGGSSTNIFVVTSDDDCAKEENTTIFVEENGDYEERFECSECGVASLHKRDHLRHLRLQHNLRPYECKYCKKAFTSKVSLHNHTLLHEAESPNSCSHCSKSFESASQLKQHMLEYDTLHLGDKNLSVQTQNYLSCSYVNSDKDIEGNKQKCTQGCTITLDPNGLDHAICEKLKLFVCDICKLKFMTSGGLNRHRKVHDRTFNSEADELGIRCSWCQAKFSFENSLAEHVATVHGPFVEQRESKFLLDENTSNSSVIEQLKEKLNEGYAPKTSELYDEPAEGETNELSSKDPFRCGICNDPFKDIDILCDHYANCHTGNQSFHCSLCSVGCTSSQQLQSHKVIHDEEEKLSLPDSTSDDLPFFCFLCKKTYKSEQDLEKHSKTHTQEKQYKCNFCSAAFFIKSALDKHILVHTGQRPFVCDICLKGFRQSAALVRHKLWTHRLKNQNKCEICGKTFFTRNLLLFHLDSHGEEGGAIKRRLRSVQSPRPQLSNTKAAALHLASEDDLEENDQSDRNRMCEYCNKEFPNIVALLTHKINHKLSASYKCDVCHRTFREKRYLKKHKLTHKGMKRWKCDICPKAFATKLTLIRHSHVHLREALRPDVNEIFKEESPPFVGPLSTLPTELACKVCSMEFQHKSHYVRHKLLHSEIPLLKCGICGKIFVHKSDVIRHKVMHSFMFTCKVCNKNFHKRSLYNLHVKKHSDSKPFKCDKCDKGFASSGNFKIHQRIHSGEKPYHCNICDYKCSQSGRLVKHKRMHAGTKLAQCKICGKSYSNTESLRSHLRLHTGEKPFRCNVCGKSFRNSNSLNQHANDHVKEEMYKCDQCPHKFRRSDHLQKHTLFHKMEQQVRNNSEMGLEADANIQSPLYMCELCGRVFEKKKYLYNHHNVHSREKIFSCSVCGKQLQSRLALKNHLMIHTGEMPHKCISCNKEFRNLSNLKRHEKIHSSSDSLTCEVCGEMLGDLDSFNKHKEAHVNLMMIGPDGEEAVDAEVSQQLYVFDNVQDDDAEVMNESVDATRQLIVQNPQSQFLVENSHQSLLVFPEQTETEESFDQVPSHSLDDAQLKMGTVNSGTPSPTLSLEERESIHNTQENIDNNTQQDFIMTEKLSESPVAHMIVDKTMDKTHQCDVCFKFFAKKQYLTKHKYRHREVKPHACEDCGKRFAQKFEVAVHRIKHTGERPYQCDICKKDFRSKVNLINHRMRHTGEYPYLCSVCNKGLATQIQLERHVSLHTGAQPFRCELCGKGFFQRLGLLRHLSKLHNIHTDEENLISGHTIQPSANLEVMEAISNISNLQELGVGKPLLHLMNHKKVKEESEFDPISIADMDDLNEEGQFSVVSDQPDYLLGASQDIDAKLFTSILQVRVEADCDSDALAEKNETEGDL